MTEPFFRANHEIAVHVTDLGEARRFYGELLGFELLEEGEEGLVFDAGPFQLFVIPHSEAICPILSMDVDDLDAARARLAEGGAEVMRETEDGLYFEDPFGILWDVVRRSGD
jgi:catechol 2,3-dioxygenase-like lactoylglutathione lyase family enzyme